MLFKNMTPEQKASCAEKHRDINIVHEWYESTEENFVFELEQMGLGAVQISFSGFSSQGDGASFVFESLDFTKFLTAIERTDLLEQCKSFIEDCECSCSRINYRYSHENTVQVEFSSEIVEDCDYELYEVISDFVKDKSKEIYKVLENEYDDLLSDESVQSTLECNEYNFDLSDYSIRCTSDCSCTIQESAVSLLAISTVMLNNNIGSTEACSNSFDDERIQIMMQNGIDKERSEVLIKVSISELIEVQ